MPQKPRSGLRFDVWHRHAGDRGRRDSVGRARRIFRLWHLCNQFRPWGWDGSVGTVPPAAAFLDGYVSKEPVMQSYRTSPVEGPQGGIWVGLALASSLTLVGMAFAIVYFVGV